MKSVTNLFCIRARLFLAILTCGCALAAPALADEQAANAGSQGGAQAAPASEKPEESASAGELTGDRGGVRDQLEKKGITFGLSWIGETFRNFEGGKDTADTVVASTADLNFALDTGKAFNWPGGKFYVDLEDHAGQNPSDVLTGDLQLFDKLNSPPCFQVFELYCQQKLFGDTLRLKVGKVDANTEFSVIDNGLDFIDSSAQVSPTVLAFPTTPVPLPGANVFFTPIDCFFASFGAYLANQTDRFLDFSGSPSNFQPTRNGMFFIGETGLKWAHSPVLQYDGNLKLGFWGHTGTFDRFDGGTQKGAEGFYAILDQTLWKPAGAKNDDPRGVRTFLEFGGTDPAVSTIYRHVGGGVAWKGFLPERPDDSIGFSPECAFLSHQAGLPHPYELIMEAFYKMKLTGWAALQPDVQYISHPGGVYSDALVGTLQLSVQF